MQIKNNRPANYLAVYALVQIAALFFLRRIYLLTVYQTVLAYAAVSFFGVLIFHLKDGRTAEQFKNIYAAIWSAFHGIIVLGFLTNGGFFLTLTQLTPVHIVNFFLGILLFWILYMITGRRGMAVGIGNLLLGILGTANHYLVLFRGAPFQISDILAARTAQNVVSNYKFRLDVCLVLSAADLVIWFFLIKKTQSPALIAANEDRNGQEVSEHLPKANEERKIGRPDFRKGLRRIFQKRGIAEWGVTALVLAGCAVLANSSFFRIYNQIGQFTSDNYLADLLVDIVGSAQSYPDGYDSAKAADILAADRQNGWDNSNTQLYSTKKPNIVVIMNEAFSDLRVLGEIPTDMPFLEYWDSLRENCIKGWANVSVLGGTTANTEYEFLSSDAVSLYTGGVIPYNNYFKSDEIYPGLVSGLKAQGYQAAAFHPYFQSGWNRMQVYRAMQFDDIIFSENLKEELDSLRIYTSDKGDYDFIRSWFTQKEKGVPQFFFNVTMQNHGGYTYEGDNFKTTVHLTGELAGKFPQAEQYLSLMRESDSALKELLSFFESYDEPVIVVLFGDHQPNLEPDFYAAVTGQKQEAWNLSQRAALYKTPFLIWHNYETDFYDIGDISVNYLAPLLMEDAGLSMSRYQEYLLGKRRQLPVVNTIGVWDAEGNLYARGSGEYGRLTEEMQLLVYNHTVDRERRAEGF